MIDANLFNPDILYVVNFWNDKENYRGYHCHDFIEISIVMEGIVEYEFNGTTSIFEEGQVLLFNPGIYHNENQPPHTSSYELHIGITNVFLDELTVNRFPNTSPVISLGTSQKDFMNLCWRLVKEYNQQKPLYQITGKGIILEMLAVILRQLQSNHFSSLFLSKKKQTKQKAVNHIIYYLENHYTEDITLEILTNESSFSKNVLTKIFKETTGLSPIQYLIQIRLKRAHELLTQTNLSIKEIAEKVGYEDQYYFSKLFKRYYGEAPSKIERTQED